jgi:hypothetical protein
MDHYRKAGNQAKKITGILQCKKCGSIMTTINSEEAPQMFLSAFVKGLRKRHHHQRSMLGCQYSQAKKLHTKDKNARTAK